MSRLEIERALLTRLESTPGIAFYALADKLGVEDARLRRLFPELPVELDNKLHVRRRLRRWRRLLAFGRTLRVLKAQLEPEERAFNQHTLFARTGIMIRGRRPKESLFSSKEHIVNWVRQRPTV